MGRLVSGAALDIGRNPKRPTNQDRLAVFEPLAPHCPDHLYLVCDGMGGHLHGEIASGIAAEEIPRAYLEARRGGTVEEALRAAVEDAHQSIRTQSASSGLAGRMGTTAVVAVVAGDALTVANVGDSRAYLVRGGSIRQISKDHTRAAEVKELGLERDLAPIGRSVLTRSLSAGREQVEPDLFVEQFRNGDALILCSDGLWSCVPDAGIRSVVEELSPDAAAPKLVQMANRAGGPDNISVIVVRKGDRGAKRKEDDTGEFEALSPGTP